MSFIYESLSLKIPVSTIWALVMDTEHLLDLTWELRGRERIQFSPTLPNEETKVIVSFFSVWSPDLS